MYQLSRSWSLITLHTPHTRLVFMPLPNVEWPEVLRLFCESVRESVCLSVCASQTLFTQCLEEYWTYFNQTFSIGAPWDRMNTSTFEVKRSKSLWAPTYWKTHFLALLTAQCLENYWTELQQTCLLVYIRWVMNWSDFAGCGVKVKVTTKSLKKFGTPYLLNHSDIWSQGEAEGYSQVQGHFKVKYFSELLQRAEACTSTLRHWCLI